MLAVVLPGQCSMNGMGQGIEGVIILLDPGISVRGLTPEMKLGDMWTYKYHKLSYPQKSLSLKLLQLLLEN